MKKRLFVVLIVLGLAIGFSSFASAAPAQVLANVTIDAVGPDSQGNWVNVQNRTLPSKLSTFDEYLYLQVTSIGNYTTVYIYRNGSLIDNRKISRYIHNPITSGNIATGWIDCYKIPLSALGVSPRSYLGQISVKEDSVNAGPTLTGYVDNVAFE